MPLKPPDIAEKEHIFFWKIIRNETKKPLGLPSSHHQEGSNCGRGGDKALFWRQATVGHQYLSGEGWMRDRQEGNFPKHSLN